jgi:hypothetical protein
MMTGVTLLLPASMPAQGTPKGISLLIVYFHHSR